MSEFTVIRAVSETLKALLEDHITNSSEPQVTGVPIELKSPKAILEDNNATGVSLWLFRVNRNPHLLNRPRQRVTQEQLAPNPFPADLHYLVTPITTDPLTKQALLGRVLQVFQDHAILQGADLKAGLAGSTEELRVNFDALSLEDVTRIWNSLEEPYQLSVTYLVQAVLVDSDHEPRQTHPVETIAGEYRQILAVS